MSDKLVGVITEGVAGIYRVATLKGVFDCPARGLFRLQDVTPLVGDRVKLISIDEERMTAVVHEILERKNELLRPKVANIDWTLITFSVKKPALNYQLLDEMILQSETSNIHCGIVINKLDLAAQGVGKQVKEVYSPLGYPVFLASVPNNEGIEEIKAFLKGKVTLFLGPSGVGKTSIINALSATHDLKTGEVSKKTERGKHTTRQTSLLQIDEDTFVMDSPGFTALSTDIEYRELWHYYPEMEKLAGQCQFTDCIHYKETKCAIKENVGKTIDIGRYERYVQILEKSMQKEIKW